ncbi:MAG TPA: hypothetical protein VGK73_08650 [Polyangiaceae bacterium]
MASIARVKRAHRHLAAETARAVDDAMAFAGRFAVQHVHDHPEFKPRTGALQSATKARVVRTKGGKLLKLSNRKPYAAAIDRGARPHVIRAKSGGVLRFRGRNGWVSKREVQHPGNRPYKFLYRAHSAAYRVLGTNLTQRLTAIARRF